MYLIFIKKKEYMFSYLILVIIIFRLIVKRGTCKFTLIHFQENIICLKETIKVCVSSAGKINFGTKFLMGRCGGVP